MSNKGKHASPPHQALLREEMFRKAADHVSTELPNNGTADDGQAGRAVRPGGPDSGTSHDGVSNNKASHNNRPGRKDGAKAGTGVFQRLTTLYADMQEAYARTAGSAGLSCAECPRNCCHSYFRHHSFVEWTYLWRGIQELTDAKRKIPLERARAYAAETELALDSNAIPSMACPLLEEGRCSLYSHRLMICRMHGTRNSLTMPDGTARIFQGCFRYVEKTRDNPAPPTLDRTPFYSRLAALELEFRRRGTLNGRVDLTIAEMLLLGPPK